MKKLLFIIMLGQISFCCAMEAPTKWPQTKTGNESSINPCYSEFSSKSFESVLHGYAQVCTQKRTTPGWGAPEDDECLQEPSFDSVEPAQEETDCVSLLLTEEDKSRGRQEQRREESSEYQEELDQTDKPITTYLSSEQIVGLTDKQQKVFNNLDEEMKKFLACRSIHEIQYNLNDEEVSSDKKSSEENHEENFQEEHVVKEERQSEENGSEDNGEVTNVQADVKEMPEKKSNTFSTSWFANLFSFSWWRSATTHFFSAKLFSYTFWQKSLFGTSTLSHSSRSTSGSQSVSGIGGVTMTQTTDEPGSTRTIGKVTSGSEVRVTQTNNNNGNVQHVDLGNGKFFIRQGHGSSYESVTVGSNSIIHDYGSTTIVTDNGEYISKSNQVHTVTLNGKQYTGKAIIKRDGKIWVDGNLAYTITQEEIEAERKQQEEDRQTREEAKTQRELRKILRKQKQEELREMLAKAELERKAALARQKAERNAELARARAEREKELRQRELERRKRK